MTSLTIRRWHSYIGLFIAPSVLFFALTGAVQLYNLHEAHGAYQPPAILEKMSSVHKDQVFGADHHEPDAGNPPPPAAADADKPSLPTVLLKAFFLAIAVGLSISTAFGLWMGLTQSRQPRLSWLLVIAGTLIPVLLASI